MEHQISNSAYVSLVVCDIGPRQEMKKGRLIPGHRKVLIGKWRSELEVSYEGLDPDTDCPVILRNRRRKVNGMFWVVSKN